MEEYGSATYGDRIAEVYDDWSGVPADSEEAAAFLAERAADGPVLELGIGTGRIALPLAARGLEVHGIDASERMVARLRAKPGGADIPVTVGDFTDVGLRPSQPRVFPLVLAVFSTFFALPSQDDQVRCFAGVAARLAPGGAFVIEAFVPDVSRFRQGHHTAVQSVGVDRVRLDVSMHDPVEQRIRAQHVVLDEGGVRLYPVQIRYAWPAELDLMARLAGLRLAERWAGWRCEPFTGQSVRHVSVYRKAP
ncbi:MAG TPA: class I SAM-dependent methyltransferase [Actinomycetes bacterium]|jgi:SAM-dependent methyltransferase|nr:class I SAM-dependent methyltransferase [Actinomycetes bacterium]